MVGDDLARVLRDRARGPPLPAARRVPVAGPVPRRHHARRAAPRRSRWCATDGLALRAALSAGGLTWTCPSSPSSAAPTSASRPCSTASSVAARPSSRRSPASPATARRSRPSGRASPSCSSTPAAGCPGGSDLDSKVSRQSERAIHDAQAVLMVVDAVVGVTEEDSRVAELLRRIDAPVLLAANKVDDTNREPACGSSWASAWAIPSRSARCTAAAPATCSTPCARRCPTTEHRRRVADRRRGGRGGGDGRRPGRQGLLGGAGRAGPTWASRRCSTASSATTARWCTTCPAPPATRSTRWSRPTRGRCASSTPPGMRRKARIDEGTEYYSFVRALQSIDTADVALLVIDATVGVTHQDQRLAERIDAAGCPVVVLLNKWETLDAEARHRGHLPGRPAAALPRRRRRCSRSARSTGKGVHQLLPALADTIDDYHKRVPTRKVNEVIRVGAVGPARPARRAGALRGAGRHRSAHLHAVRQQGRCRPPTCATSSAGCARSSTSGRRPSSCASGSARAEGRRTAAAVKISDILDLVPHGPDTFVGTGPQYPWGGLYGGQIVAQALQAATAPSTTGSPPHSLRAYFIRRGDHDEPVRYEVDRIRNGRSFCTRRVVARQAIGAILNLEASFQVPEERRRHRDRVVPGRTCPVPPSSPRPRGRRCSRAASSRRRSSTRPVARGGAGRRPGCGSPRPRRPTRSAPGGLAYLSDDLPTDAVVRAHPLGRRVRRGAALGAVHGQPRPHHLVPPAGAARPLAPARLHAARPSWAAGACRSGTSSTRTAATWPPWPRKCCCGTPGTAERTGQCDGRARPTAFLTGPLR